MFFSLLAGLILAFAFQLMLTSLEVALGLSFAGWALASSRAADESAQSESQSSESSSSEPISHFLGAGVAFSLAVVLFAASFLTVQFSGFDQPRVGLIFGTILWAAYLLILSWLSSVAVSSIIGAVLGTAATGIRRLFSAIGQTVSLAEAAPLSETERLQIIAGELSEAIASQQQLPELLEQQRETLLAEISDRTKLPVQQAEAILQEVRTLREQGEEESGGEDEPAQAVENEIGNGGSGNGVERESALTSLLPDWRRLLRLARSQVDFSDWDVETVWQAFQALEGYRQQSPVNVINLDIEDYLLEIPRWALRSEWVSQEFVERLYDPEADPGQVKAQLMSLKRSDFVHWLKQRGDLTEETAQAMADRLETIYRSVVETVQAEAASADTSRWQQLLSDQLNKLPLETFSADDLKSWLQDSVDYQGSAGAAAENIQRALTHLDSEAIADVFEHHPTLKPEQKEDFVQAFEQGRSAVLERFEKQQTAAISEALTEVQTKLLAYFRYTSLDKLTAESVQQKVQDLKSMARDQLAATHLFEDSPAGEAQYSVGVASPMHFDTLVVDKISSNRADSLPDLEGLGEVIAKRNGMTDGQQRELTQALTAAWTADQPTAEPAASNSEDSDQDEAFYSALIDAFQTIDWPNVSLEDVKPDLSGRVSALLSNLTAIPSQIDTSRVIDALSLPSDVRSELADWLQQSQREWLKLPRRWAQRTVRTSEDWGSQLKSQLRDYLQFEDKSAFTPGQLLAEVTRLVKRMVSALPSLPTELPQIDASFFRETLSQRPDLSAAEREQIADKLASVWQTLSHSMSDWEDELQSAAHQLKQAVSQNADDMASLGGNLLDTARQQVVGAFEQAQETVTLQTAAVKQELKQQAEQVRQQIAIAAWWLFISLLTSGLASAGAGWLAVKLSI